jgi:hypothetical protein
MKNRAELMRAGRDLAECIKKNCAEAVQLRAYMDVTIGMMGVMADMRGKKGAPSAEEIREARKKVEALKKKGDKARLTAEDAICALKNCEREWEAWAEAQKKQAQGEYEQVIAMLAWTEKQRAAKESRGRRAAKGKGEKAKKG